MIDSRNVKYVAITPPGAIVDNGSYTTTSVDTKGWDHCSFVCLLGDTDIAMTALKVQESDDDGSSDTYADVTGLVYGTSTDIDGNTSALPAADDDDSFFVFEVDCKARKRYLDLVATAGNGTAGTYLTAFAILSRGKETPTTVAAKGCAGVLRA